MKGKPHKLMVEELERSYDLKVELLRHEMRVMEQQRENDIQRALRKGKSKVKMQQRDFCAMCNLNFLGLLPAHRKNERHQVNSFSSLIFLQLCICFRWRILSIFIYKSV